MKPPGEGLVRVIGHGIDMVDIGRIERLLDGGADRFDGWLTTTELSESRKRQDIARFIAGRIAAKEAVAKAIGTGFDEHVSWQDIEISTSPTGAPKVTLTAGAAAKADAAGIGSVLVSLSYVQSTALASAIALGA